MAHGEEGQPEGVCQSARDYQFPLLSSSRISVSSVVVFTDISLISAELPRCIQMTSITTLLPRE